MCSMLAWSTLSPLHLHKLAVLRAKIVQIVAGMPTIPELVQPEADVVTAQESDNILKGEFEVGSPLKIRP